MHVSYSVWYLTWVLKTWVKFEIKFDWRFSGDEVDWLIDCLLFHASSTGPRRRLLVKCDQFLYFKVSLAALKSLLSIEIQRNGLLRAKGVVILDTGRHLTSHPTDYDMQGIYTEYLL